jgi:cytochrome b6-f complex iron-sulfur subunit
MLVALAIVGGLVLVAALLFAMTRRQDRQAAIGLLSRETRKRDRSGAALEPIDLEEPAQPTARDVERSVAVERAGAGAASTAVVVARDARPVPAPLPPLDEEALGVTRRQFLNRGILGLFGLSLAGFGATVLGFLWPPPGGGGFGSKVKAGTVDDINAYITANTAPFYVPAARTYIQPYPVADVGKATKTGAYADPVLAGMSLGFVALYQKCVHLGCRVPWCQSSQWFECPCHGSQYNRVGEKKGGPAPRGLDRFGLTVDGGIVTVDTSKSAYLGPPIGTNTTGQEAEGPHCH